MQAIVLAGGFGTRLRSRLADLPKPMAPVAGRPFLEYILDRLDAAGCERVVLATGHLAQSIESHFGQRYGSLDIDYSRELTPLGTGGAIVNALRAMPQLPTLVMNGDSFVDIDLAAFWQWCGTEPAADAIIVRSLDDVARYGAVTLVGDRVTSFGEKGTRGPGLISTGIYRLRLSSFEPFELPSVFSIEHDFLQPHMHRLGMRGYVAAGRFIDIGLPDAYDRAQTELPRWTAAS